MGVARAHALAPAGVTDAPVGRDLVLLEAVLGRLAGGEGAGLQLRPELGAADDALAGAALFWNKSGRIIAPDWHTCAA